MSLIFVSKLLFIYALQYIDQIIGIMLAKNSSKVDSKIFNSRKQQLVCVEVQICGEAKILYYHDFFELTQLVNVLNMPQIKNLGLHSLVYSEKNITVLHIFLYYCIKVNLELEIQGLDEMYLKQLGSFYVSAGFNIQIAKYAKFFSLTTRIEVKKCAHMIYYLVYGRLATSSYISHIIQANSKAESKKQRLRTVISTKYINKKDSSFRSQKAAQTNQSELLQNNYQELAQDLKIIFKNAPKKWQQGPKQIDNQDEEYSQISTDIEKSGDVKNKYYMSFFPNRVFNQQKSAIFQRIIPASKSHCRLMRKKKFDQTKLDKMLYTSFNQTVREQTQEDNTKEQGMHKKHRSKIFTQNVTKTNEKFKNICQNLDKIRSTLTKSKRQTHNWQTGNAEADQSMGDCEKSYIQFKEKMQNNKKSDVMMSCDLAKVEYQSENKFGSLLRKQNRGMRGQKDSQYTTRRKENKNFGLGFDSISKRDSNKIGYSDCKTRLTQYKNEFRRFIKVHLFRSDDQN